MKIEHKKLISVYILILFITFLALVIPCLENEDVPSQEIAEVSFYSIPGGVKTTLIEKMDKFKEEHRNFVQQNLYQDNFEQFLPPAGYVQDMEKEETLKFGNLNLYLSKNKMRWLSNNLMSSSVWDEQNSFKALYNIRPEKFDFNPHYFRYGGAWLYPVGLTLYVSSKAGIFKAVKDVSYYMYHPQDIRKISITGKSLGIASYLLAVLVLLLICTRFFSIKIFCIGAFFMVFCPAVIVESVYFKPMLMSLFWYLLGIFFILKIICGRGNIKVNCLCAGISSGLAAGSLMPSASIILPLFVSVAYQRIISVRYGITRLFRAPYKDIGYFIYALIFFALSFLLTNPYTVLSFREFIKEMLWNVGYHNYYSFWDLKIHLGNILILLDGFGWFFGLLMLISIFWVIKKKRSKQNAVILCAVGAYYLWGYSTNYALSILHALIPIVPLLILFPAQLIENTLSKESGVIKKLSYLLVAAVAVYSLLNSLFYVFLFKQKPRIDSGAWINKNIPSGASIGTFVDNCALAFNYPYYSYFRYRFVNDDDFKLARINKEAPDYYILVNSYIPKWLTVPEKDIPAEYRQYIDSSSKGTHYRWLLKIDEEAIISPHYKEIIRFDNSPGILSKLFKNKLVLWWVKEIKIYKRIQDKHDN